MLSEVVAVFVTVTVFSWLEVFNSWAANVRPAGASFTTVPVPVSGVGFAVTQYGAEATLFYLSFLPVIGASVAALVGLRRS